MSGHELSPRNFFARGAVNQRLGKVEAENARRLFGTSSKATKAMSRNTAFQNGLSEQIFNRSLCHIVEGKATFEDIAFVRRNQQNFPTPEGVDIVARIGQIKDILYS